MGCCIPGRLAEVEVSGDGGDTWVRLGEVVDATLNITIDELECTSFDSNGQREFQPNFNEQTIDGSLRWCETDVGQNIVANAVFSKTLFMCRFKLIAGEGYKLFQAGSAFATSYNAEASVDDTAMVSFSLRLNSIVMTYQA